MLRKNDLISICTRGGEIPTYIALLRGVNVGGNPLKMQRLVELLGEIGCQNVRTYVQSGNVVFARKGTAKHWQAAIEGCLAGQTRLPVRVLVRTAAQVAKTLRENPFLHEPGIDATKLHVTFLGAKPSAEGLKKLAAIAAGRDRYHVAGHQVYLHCPDGYGRSKLAGATLERVLGVPTTTRNWNTISALHKITVS